MGIAVSGWALARAVSRLGHLGVVSGAGIDLITFRRLQDGDPGGRIRRALEAFPVPALARRVLDRYFREGGRAPAEAYRRLPFHDGTPNRELDELGVAASFAEIRLAREGHDGLVGMNLLTKMTLPTLPALYGAMLAGVDVVIMGAGIPRDIPGALDRLAVHADAEIQLPVEGDPAGHPVRFRPVDVLGVRLAPLKRPRFLPIVASNVLAMSLVRHGTGRVDGFIVEGPTAGGHNAPPRGPLSLNPRGEPKYGPKDEVDLAALKKLGLPFWLAGGRAEPAKLREALELGAEGIQVGTAFALCRESGLLPEIKAALVARVRAGNADVFTDPKASPTGFPFKVARLEGTLSEPGVFEARERVCDLGYLRSAYRKPDGGLGFRCPAEPEDAWARKGGDPAESADRKCLCNGLLAAAGLGQVRKDGRPEPPILTSGDDLLGLGRILPPEGDSYSAEDVIRYLESAVPATASRPGSP